MANAELFASVAQTPAALALRQRLESGGVLSCDAVSASAQPFLAALLRHLFPTRPLVVVTDGLKTQESFHQDVSTWTSFLAADAEKPGHDNLAPLFYPAWETLPHESKLPHADIISERLETLVALSAWTNSKLETRNHRSSFPASPRCSSGPSARSTSASVLAHSGAATRLIRSTSSNGSMTRAMSRRCR